MSYRDVYVNPDGEDMEEGLPYLNIYGHHGESGGQTHICIADRGEVAIIRLNDDGFKALWEEMQRIAQDKGLIARDGVPTDDSWERELSA